MPIITYTQYVPAKYIGSEEEFACNNHELKLYGWLEKKLKEWGANTLAYCGQWEGADARMLMVIYIPAEHLNDWQQEIAKRSTIFLQKQDGYYSDYEIWASREDIRDIFIDEPSVQAQYANHQKLIEKYGPPE
jgi:hypothetical protein